MNESCERLSRARFNRLYRVAGEVRDPIKSGFVRIQPKVGVRFLIGRINPAYSIEENHEK
jgi:hypothetical protein